MDIFCRVCGEPLDADELHDIEGMTYAQARAAFTREGCAGVGMTHGKHTAMSFVGVLTDLMGDDVDGLAAMFDDITDIDEFLGWEVGK